MDASKCTALELDGFIPYEECERLLSIQTSIERDIDSDTETELDPQYYKVEKIIKKRFNAGRVNMNIL